MKKFTTEEIRGLFNQVMREEIGFSKMVELINERMSEANKPQYKDGDFVVNKAGSILIFKKKVGDFIYDHAYLVDGLFFIASVSFHTPIERYATETEKQELLNALAKKGKRWNAEKKCIEDIPKRKFKKGDKVRIKHGVSSKTHCDVSPDFIEEMDVFIGKTMTVDRYTDRNNYVVCHGCFFSEDWLEPYVEELKEGDLAIFWDDNKDQAVIRFYEQSNGSEKGCFRHKDQNKINWINAIKFESIEQYKRLIKGEI